MDNNIDKKILIRYAIMGNNIMRTNNKGGISIKKLNAFLNQLNTEKKYSINTIDAYKTDITQFINFTVKNITEVEKSDILNFLKHLQNKGYSPTTINRKLASIKSFYRYLFVKGEIRVNPAELIKPMEYKSPLPRLVTIEEYKLVSSIIDNLEDKALIEMLFIMGIKREEIIIIKRSDFNFNNNTLKIPGKKERTMSFIPEIIPNTLLWLSQHDSKWLFPSKRNKGNHNTTRWVNKAIRKWAIKAELPNVTPQALYKSSEILFLKNSPDTGKKALEEATGVKIPKFPYSL